MSFNHFPLVVSSDNRYTYGLENDEPYLYENQDFEEESDESEEDPID